MVIERTAASPTSRATHGLLPPLAWRPVAVTAAALAALLLALSTRYGYHRDELYFLAAGQRLAWGYPDQPPLTPTIARLATEVAGNSLVALRLPSALMAGALVVLTALLARELGGGRSAQLLAAAAAAVSTTTFVVFHMATTTALDLLVWTAITLLALSGSCGRATSACGWRSGRSPASVCSTRPSWSSCSPPWPSGSSSEAPDASSAAAGSGWAA